MGVGQELTNGLKGVGHVFSFMLKQKKSPPPPHINNDRSLKIAVCLDIFLQGEHPRLTSRAARSEML